MSGQRPSDCALNTGYAGRDAEEAAHWFVIPQNGGSIQSFTMMCRITTPRPLFRVQATQDRLTQARQTVASSRLEQKVPALGHTRCSTGQARKIITTSTAHAQVRALRDKCRDYNLQAAPCSIYRITLIHGPEITADTRICSHNLFTNYKQNQATRYKSPHNRVQGDSLKRHTAAPFTHTTHKDS